MDCRIFSLARLFYLQASFYIGISGEIHFRFILNLITVVQVAFNRPWVCWRLALFHLYQNSLFLVDLVSHTTNNSTLLSWPRFFKSKQWWRVKQVISFPFINNINVMSKPQLRVVILCYPFPPFDRNHYFDLVVTTNLIGSNRFAITDKAHSSAPIWQSAPGLAKPDRRPTSQQR